MASKISPAVTVTSRLEKLPPETLTEILVHFDPPSLITVAQCSRFLHDFISDDDLLLPKILLREVGPAVLPDAFIAHHMPRSTSVSFEDMKEWCAEHLGQEKRPDSSSMNAFKMSLKTANAIFGLHQEVQILVPMMIDKAASRHAPLAATLKDLPLSDLETQRFCRALYRYEVFTKLVDGSFSHMTYWTQNPLLTLFVHHYYGFVDVAQQTCVAAMLSLCVTSVFNIVAREDIFWRAERKLVAWPQCGHIQYLVTRGLHGIYRFLAAETYNDQAKALGTLQPGWGTSHEKDSSILDHLQDSILPDELWPRRWDHSRFDAKTIRSRAISFPDADPGPAMTTKFVHTSAILRTSRLHVGREYYEILREWGYAMWDQRRIDTIGFVVTSASINAAIRARSDAKLSGEMTLGTTFRTISDRKSAWYRKKVRGRCPDGWPIPGVPVDAKKQTKQLYARAELSQHDTKEPAFDATKSWVLGWEDQRHVQYEVIDGKYQRVDARSWIGDWN